MQRVGMIVAVSAIAAIVTLLGLVYGLGMETVDAFYISFTVGAAAAAAVALTEREANLGVVASAAALLLMLGILGPYLGLTSAFVFKGQTYEIAIPTEYIPWIMLGLVGVFVIGYAVGADVGRLGLWVLGSILAMFWFTVTDVTSQVILSCLIAIIAAVPLLKKEARAGGYLLAAAIIPASPLAGRTQITFDLTQVNYFGMLVTPVLLFLALDPFNVIENRKIEEICSVIVLFLAFLQLLSAVLA